jgi:hypothetical protein
MKIVISENLLPDKCNATDVHEILTTAERLA